MYQKKTLRENISPVLWAVTREGKDPRRTALSELTISQGRGRKRSEGAVASDTHQLFTFQEGNIAN